MNDLEDLLYDAMSRQVAGVVVEPGLVRAVVRRRARRRRTGRSAVALTAAVAVAGGTVAVEKSRSERPAALAPAARTVASPSPLPDAADEAFGAALVDNYLPATGAEATAGNRAQAEISLVTDEAVAACRARRGLAASTTPPETVSELADSFMDPSDFPDRAWFERHGSFTLFTSTPGSPVLSAPPTQCLTDDIRAEVFPSLGGWATLTGPWMTALPAAESTPAIKASLLGFRSCVLAAGAVPRDATTFTGDDAGPNDGASSRAFGDFIGFAGGPADGADFGPREKPWVPVFDRCAGPTIDLQEAAQTASRETFEAAHAAELAALETQTEAELAAAEAKFGTPAP